MLLDVIKAKENISQQQVEINQSNNNNSQNSMKRSSGSLSDTTKVFKVQKLN